MQFYKHLYVKSDLESKKLWKIKWKLKHNAGMFGIFVITLSNGNDQLEIINSAYLHQKYYKLNKPFIVGIARSKDEAYELVQNMFIDSFIETKSYQVKEFLQLKQSQKKD